jgi:hypothetical protein
MQQNETLSWSGQPGVVPNATLTKSGVSAREARLVALLLLTIALSLRAPYFGNPDYHVDEEFYALVAERMWHGALPFVDIWDRKPIGLFLVYAAFQPLNVVGLIAVQLAGLAFAVATAFVIWRMAQRYLAALSALLPATLYIIWLGVFGGANAQSPVFYNLPMALAAACCLRALDGEQTSFGAFLRSGAWIMLLVGLAIQIKYTAIFEGLFLGLWLVGIMLVRFGLSFQSLGAAVFWAALALTPTTLVALTYAGLGHWEAFAQANFTSIFLRARLEADYLANLELFVVLAGLPLFSTALVALAGHLLVRSKSGRDPACWFLVGWVVFALCGFAAIGNFYDHYALPLLPPLLVVAARLFGPRIGGPLLFILLALWAMAWWPKRPWEANARSRAAIAHLTETAKPLLAHGALYVWDGPSILYVTTGTAPISRFAYPDHLSNDVERNALGVDTGQEMSRILGQRPAVIISASRKIIPVYNAVTSAGIRQALARDYVLIDRQKEGWGHRDYLLYGRKDLVAEQAPVD